MDTRKDTKKKPAKSLQEKRAEKREKKQTTAVTNFRAETLGGLGQLANCTSASA